MKESAPLLWLLATSAALGANARAQQDPVPLPLPSPQLAQESEPALYIYEGSGRSIERDDYREMHLVGGFRFSAPHLRLEIRGLNALLLSDLDAARRALDGGSGAGLPRRTLPQPTPRRRLTSAEIRERLDRTLRAVGRLEGVPSTRASEQTLDAFRYLYFEGGVVVVHAGVEVLRCERMWVSPLDDRVVVENAELRYVTTGKATDNVLVVRGARLVKQGGRWTGRDLSITTCVAAEPHAAAVVGEAEIIEREGEFEVISRGQRLQVGGANLVPLPDAHIFTASQSEFPIRRASASYSGKQGVQAELVLGLHWNKTGGAVHEWLTGRPAHEFRGDWEFGVGWIEKRGVPLEGGVSYAAKGLYEGRTEAFWLDDRGEDLREIQGNFDGSPIDNEGRGLVKTENRVHLGRRTHVDLVAFHAADPAVYSEFFPGDYRIDETPETSGYVHHAENNRLFTVGTRFNLDDFSYRDNRSLSERFVEELPVVTYDWIAQPLGETPWGTPLVVDMATEVGQRRSNYDDRAGFRVGDRTLRADQHVELSAPFHWGSINFRPFAAGRGTFYDNAVDGESEGRVAFEGGFQAGTRLSRTWSWLDDDGEMRGVRHVIAPRVSYHNRFRVDDDRTNELFVFDTQDVLREEQLVRLELRNLLQSMAKTDLGRQPRDFVLLDLAQDVWPDKGRDNGGDTLGLFYYDLLVRPQVRWLPFDTFTLAVYGDHDWKDGMRTFDTEVQFGPIAGVTWTADYREDFLVDGAVGLTASTLIADRWNVFAGSQRDLDRDEWLSYSFGMQRNDHDWSISLSAVYNPFSDETTLRLEFLPRFGGMNAGRRDRFGGGDMPGQFATAY